MEKLDWELFKDKFHPSWHRFMKDAIESEWMFNIYQQLKQDAKKENIYPASADTFRTFKECKYDDIKCIIVLQD